jgi:hypothetical protein
MYARQSGGTGEANPSLAGIAALIGPTQDFEIWPENMPAINLFRTMQTQLRAAGGGGVLGFDYTAYFARMDRLKLSDQDYEWMFEDIQAIESAAIPAMNKKD